MSLYHLCMYVSIYICIRKRNDTFNQIKTKFQKRENHKTSKKETVLLKYIVTGFVVEFELKKNFFIIKTF